MSVDWIKTEQGLVRFVVLKAFFLNFARVNRLSDGTERITSDTRHFLRGTTLLDPNDPRDAAVINHSWIAETFADGHVERPEQTRARLEVEVRNAEVQTAHHAQILRDAKASLDREVAAAQGRALHTRALDADLNRPLTPPGPRILLPGEADASIPHALRPMDPGSVDTVVGSQGDGAVGEETDPGVADGPTIEEELNTPLSQLGQPRPAAVKPAAQTNKSRK